jgi:hypothetical protein
MYNDTSYRGEELTAFFETPEIAVDTNDKYFSQLYIYYDKSGSNTLTLDATINSTQNKSATITYTGAFYADDYYNETYYLTTDDEEDYSLVHIDRYGKWMRFKITTQTQASIKGWKLVGRAISNKEL